MSSRDMLYRNVLRGTPQDTSQVCDGDLSPMSNLAYNLHHGAHLSQTPRRKLSLSSCLSDTPQSCQDLSMNSTIGVLHDSISSDSSVSGTEEGSASSSVISPSRRLAPRGKENFPSPYYSPSRSTALQTRPRPSPLKDLQNTVNRNLTFSPLKKNLQLVSPSKRLFMSPQKPSPLEDFDTNSQDSGYSESGKKMDDDCFSVPVSCAPRKLNLDLSPPKPSFPKSQSQTFISPTMASSPKTRTSMSPPTTFLSPSKWRTSTSPKLSKLSPGNASSTVTNTSSAVSPSTNVDGRRPFRKFSLLKGDEEDTMLMDMMNEQTSKDDQPLGFSDLLSKPIQPITTTITALPKISSIQTLPTRPSIRRCLSMKDITPTSSRVQYTTFEGTPLSSYNTISNFKRPHTPSDFNGDVENKRRKQDENAELLSPLTSNASTTVAGDSSKSPRVLRQVSAPEASFSEPAPPKFVRCHSESQVSIMKALNKCSNHNGELTGDFSKPIALPTVEGGKHPDLKAISVDTLAELLEGKYSKTIASYKIIDCRYPYEFEGGHITGAEMWHHPKMVEEHLVSQKGAPVITSDESQRHILIFHCEFSAERGPKAQRLLREMDRKASKEHYPALHFPETYLLEGGYKAFFEKYPNHCTPVDYVKMLDANHSDDLKHFRGKSKSWAAENKQSKCRTTLPRTGLKRLGL